MEKVVEINNTSFPKQLYEALSKIKHTEKDVLRYHQRLVHDYVLKYPHVRGILAYHKMGAGKSILGASICESMLESPATEGYKILFIASKSLHINMQTNIKKYRAKIKPDETDADLDKHIDQYYNFISMNASNMITQVYRSVKPEGADEIEKLFTNLKVPEQVEQAIKRMDLSGTLNDTIIVIDEAHNLFNSITNGSKNALALYRLIMEAKRIKVVLLTGSPIVNDSFEIGVGLNMLAGPLEETTQNGQRTYFTLYGEDYEDFQGYFVGPKGIKNRDKFIHRAVGLVSYFGADSVEQMKLYPEKLPTIVENVQMSAKQYAAYITARDREIEESSRPSMGVGSKKPLQKPEGRSSSYRVRSRQFSNILYPAYASKTFRDKDGIMRYEKYIDKLKPESLQIQGSDGVGTDESGFGLEVYSPKTVRLLINLQRHTTIKFLDPKMAGKYTPKDDMKKYTKSPGIGPGVIYSQFKDAGVDMLAKVLAVHGFEEVKSKEDAEKKQIMKTKKLRYAVISGDVDVETRQELVDIVVAPENKSGEYLFTLFVTSTGAEGLDLTSGRWVMVFEPYWHYSRLGQIYARVVRMFGLQDLPVKDRYVQPYIYLADYPKIDELKKLAKDDKTKDDADEMKKKKDREPTTDVQLYQESLKNQIIINTFRQCLQEGSIDCHMHYGKNAKGIAKDKKLDCVMCAPTNRKMYINNLGKDMHAPSRCEPFEEETIKANKIVIVGDEGVEKEFMYTLRDKDSDSERPIHIFEYVDQLDAYDEIYEDNPYYDALEAAIKKKHRLK